jgi:hypothetical protein
MIAKAATRALADSEQVGPNGLQVANAYTVHLSPSDFARFASYRRSLAAQVLRYVQQYARDRGLAPAAAWRVQLVADAEVRKGSVRVEARYEDVDVAAQPEDDASVEHTRRLPILPRPGSTLGAPASAGRAWLELETGERIELGPAPVSLGRALDNVVVVPDARISRHHALVEGHGGKFIVRDVGSTNGVSLGDRPVIEHELRDGDELSLGGFRVRFRRAQA